MDSKKSDNKSPPSHIHIFSLVISCTSIFAVIGIAGWLSQKISNLQQQNALLKSTVPDLQQTLTPLQHKINQNEKTIHTLQDKLDELENKIQTLKSDTSTWEKTLSTLQTKLLEKEKAQEPVHASEPDKHQKQIDDLNQKIQSIQTRIDELPKADQNALKQDDLIKLKADLKKEIEKKISQIKQETSENIESLNSIQKENLKKLKDQVWSKIDDVKQEQTRSTQVNEDRIFREFAQLYINRMRQAVITGDSYKTDLELLYRHFKNEWPLTEKETDFLRKHQKQLPWKNDGEIIKAYYEASSSNKKSHIESILKYVEKVTRLKIKSKEDNDVSLKDSINEIKKLRQKYLDNKKEFNLSKVWLEDVDNRLKIDDLISQIDAKAKVVKQ